MNPKCFNQNNSVGLFTIIFVLTVSLGVSGCNYNFLTENVDAGDTNTNDQSSTQSITISHSSAQSIVSNHSIACNRGAPDFYHFPSSYFRIFNLSDFSIDNKFTITSVDIGIEVAESEIGSQALILNLYTLAGAPLINNLAELESTTVTIPDQSQTVYNIPITTTVPPEATLVVRLFTPDGATGHNSFFIGSNDEGESSPSYFASSDCSLSEMTTMAEFGFPDIHVLMNVNGIIAP